MTNNELCIAIDGETVIIKGINDRIFYRIRRQELALKMNDNTSEWIMQLMGKTWIEIDTLYTSGNKIDS